VVPEEVPVLGEAPDAPGFFWMAALGGAGVQIAPAAGRLIASIVAGTGDHGLDTALVARISARSLLEGRCQSTAG
jgi:D-arginine dehydrogenase